MITIASVGRRPTSGRVTAVDPESCGDLELTTAPGTCRAGGDALSGQLQVGQGQCSKTTRVRQLPACS